jgi:phosphate-selective porin OprO/OprP
MTRLRAVCRSVFVSSLVTAVAAVSVPARAQDQTPDLTPAPSRSAEPAAPATPDAAPEPVPAVPLVPPPPGPVDPSVAPPSAPQGKAAGDVSRVQLASADGNYKVEFHGLLQADGRFFLTDKGGIGTFLIRRARPVIDAKLFKVLELNLQSEFASSKFQLLDAYGNIHIWDAIQLKAGKMKAPVGLERLQSSRDTMFPELALPSLLTPNRDIGAMLHGKIADGSFEYQLGVFNGVPNGQSGEIDTNDSKDIDGRVFAQPFLQTNVDPLKGLGLGIAGTVGNQQAAPGPYQTVGGATFFSYGSSVVGLGKRWLVTPQGYYYFGPLGVLAEYARVKEHLQTPTTSGNVGTTAWAVQGSVALGGKQSFKGLRVKRPLDPANGHFGAFELGARWGDLRVGDAAFKDGFAKRDTSAQRATEWSVMGTWHLADGQHVRVTYERTNYRGGAPHGGDKKPELLLLARLQASF